MIYTLSGLMDFYVPFVSIMGFIIQDAQIIPGFFAPPDFWIIPANSTILLMERTDGNVLVDNSPPSIPLRTCPQFPETLCQCPAKRPYRRMGGQWRSLPMRHQHVGPGDVEAKHWCGITGRPIAVSHHVLMI
jgi:hypothetical protein